MCIRGILQKLYEINSSKSFGASREVYNLLRLELAQRGWNIVFKGIVVNAVNVVAVVMVLICCFLSFNASRKGKKLTFLSYFYKIDRLD